MTTLEWATVTQLSPLRIRLDGDIAALVLTPESLINTATLLVGSRVRVELYDRRILIVGLVGGEVRASGAEAIAGTDPTKIITASTLASALTSPLSRVTALETREALVRVAPTGMSVSSGSGSYASDGKVTFAGAGSVSLNGIFSAAFLNYLLLLNITSNTGGSGIYVRFGTTTTDATSGYNYGYAEHPGAGAWSFQSTTAELRIGRASTGGAACRATIFSPYATARSWIEGTSSDSDNYHAIGAGYDSTSTMRDRLTVFMSGVNMTGTLEVYGMRG